MRRMRGLAELTYDVASALSIGRRDVQEDALICDFAIGAPLGFAVLSDGMGGHAAGDMASKIVVTEVFAELKLQSGDPAALEADMAGILQGAAHSANDCIGAHAGTDPGTRGMGATLVAPVVMQDRLYWVSIGDSPLYLFRDGELKQLNQDHSMAPQIDFLARTGLMDAEAASTHPDRQCLTSVLAGREIARVDCPQEPLQLRGGDIVIAASDGLQFLEDGEIGEVLKERATGTSAEISAALLRSLESLDDPEQDNVSFCIIRVREAAEDMAQPRLGNGQTGPGKVTILAAAGEAGLSMVMRRSSGGGA